MKYYQLEKEKSLEIIEILESVTKYNRLVATWLKENFTLNPNTPFYQFNETPEFTQKNIDDNPRLLKLMNKTNFRLSKSVKESKDLIESWKAHKKSNGYKTDESYTRADYAMSLRSIFPYGAVNPAIDKQNKVIILEVDEAREGLKEVSKKDFLELELKIENQKLSEDK